MGFFSGLKKFASGGTSNSIVSRIGGKMLGLDPTNALIKKVTGHDWAAAQARPGNYLADRSNKLLSEIGKPAAALDHMVNPLRRIPVYDRFASWTDAKPVDSAAIAAGAYFGAGALSGSGGGGGSGAAGSAPGGGATGASGASGGAAGGGATSGSSLPGVIGDYGFVSSQPGTIAGYGAGSGVPGAVGGNAAGAGSVVGGGGAAGSAGGALGGGAAGAGAGGAGAAGGGAMGGAAGGAGGAGGSSLLQQGIGAGMGLISNYMNNRAAGKAADALAASADKASQVQWNMYNQSRQDQLPWQQAGSNALAQMMEQMGYGVTKVGQNMMDPATGKLVETPQFAYSPNANGQSKMFAGFQGDAGRQFRQQEGNNALANRQAAGGGFLSGNAVKAAMEYNSGLASQEYGNYWNRLAGLAGVGQTANNTLSSLGQNTANAVNDNTLQGGNARASGYAARGQNNANTFNSLANMFGNYKWGG